MQTIKNKKFYVYSLTDPIKNVIFYIGKGQDARHKAHLKPSSWQDPLNTINPFLYFKIKGLMERGTPPITEIIEWFVIEDDAYDAEFKLICEYKTFNEGGPLKNISTNKGGSQSGKSYPWSDERKESHKSLCRLRRKYDPSYKELFGEYITQNLSVPFIAQSHDISTALVKNRLREMGITNMKKPRVNFEPTYEELYNEYIKENSTGKEMCANHNINQVKLSRLLKKHGIKKTPSLISKVHSKHKIEITCGFCGKTENVVPSRKKSFCSRKCSGSHKMRPFVHRGVEYENIKVASVQTGLTVDSLRSTGGRVKL